MSEQIQEVTETSTPKPAKRKVKAKKRAARAAPKADKAADKPVASGDEFAGISASTCPAACTADRCVISTVGICKHPYMSAANGCGPITLKNRERALKLIKHQIIDLQG